MKSATVVSLAVTRPCACHPGLRAGVQGGRARLPESCNSGPPIKSGVTFGSSGAGGGNLEHRRPAA
jgi:hypothetical protein